MWLKKKFSDSKNYKKENYFSLNNIDKKLTKFLSEPKKIFCEAGANDGLNQSNTAFFEKSMNWKGILIEPNPSLVALCKKNRPKSLVVQAALVSKTFSEPTIEFTSIGLMSFVKNSFKTENEQNEHIDLSQKYQQPGPTKLKVPARTLASIFDEHNVKKVDFFSLDVEGYEAQVLEGIDFNRVVIDFLLIEVRYPDDVMRALPSYYELVDKLTPRDWLFRRKE